MKILKCGAPLRNSMGMARKLLIDSTMAYIICRGHILCKIPLGKIKEAVLAFVGTFYLLDVL